MRPDTEVYLAGTTTWTPDTSERVADAVAAGKLSADAASQLATESVPIADAELSPPQMATNAARRALQVSGVSPERLVTLIHCCIWHQGHDMWSGAHFVADQVGAHAAVPLTMSQGCNAVMPAIELAAARLLADGPDSAALVTAADRFVMPGFDRWTSSYACAHGDAATATVLTRRPAGDAVLLRAIRSVAVPELEEMNRAGQDLTSAPLFGVDTLDLRGTKKSFIAKHGFDKFEGMAREAIIAALSGALAEAEVDPADPRLVGVAVPRMSKKIIFDTYFPIIAEVTDAPGVALAQETGHLSCSDPLANLADLRPGGRAGLLREPGDIAVVLNAGGGYTWSAAVVAVPA